MGPPPPRPPRRARDQQHPRLPRRPPWRETSRRFPSPRWAKAWRSTRTPSPGRWGDRAMGGRSAFADLLGEAVGRGTLTLVDDPTLDGLSGSRRIDDEGWPSAPLVLIASGRVAGLMLDRATALRARTAPTGS